MALSTLVLQSLIALTVSALLAAAAVGARRSIGGRTAVFTDTAMLVFVLTPLLSKFFLLLLLPGAGASALPLHVCDVAGAFCAYAIAKRNSHAATIGCLTALLYSSVAICQPDLGIGPTDVELVLFWTRHVSLVVASIYLMAGLGLWPTWSGYGRWLLLTVGYIAVMVPLNGMLDTKFAYLSDATTMPKVVLSLGPWPVRVLWMVLIPAAMGAALTAVLGRHAGRRSAQ